MANWNRNDQNAYTGISAQRRNRRKADSELMGPEPASRTSMIPERPAAIPRARIRTAPGDGPEKEYSAESVIYSRPEIFGEPERSAEPEAFTEPGVFAGPAEEEPEESAEPAVSGEEPAPAPVTVPEPEAEEEPEVPAETEESKEPEEPEKPAKPEEPGEVTRAVAIQEPAAQDADSRIPPEARRMAAAPYGTAGSGGRQPARPQPAGTQLSRKQPVRPRYEASGEKTTRSGERVPAGRAVRSAERMPAERTARPEGRGPANGQRARVHVGYAPGRMSDDMTRQIPTGETVRESLYTRDAREYLEKRRQPFRTEDNGNQNPPDRPGNTALRVLVALLVVAGLALTVVLLLKHQNDPELIVREMPQIIEFSTPKPEELVAPQELNYFVKTDKNADGVRLRGENDEDLDTTAVVGDNTSEKIWNMKLVVPTGLQGKVFLQVKRIGDDNWYYTGNTAEVNVSSPLEVEQASAAVPEQDQAENPSVPEGEPAEDTDGEPEAVSGEDEAEPEEDAEGISGEDEDGGAEDWPEEDTEDEPEGDAEGEAENEPAERWAADDELPNGELKTPVPTSTRAPDEPTATPVPPLTAEADPKADPALIASTTVYTSVTKKEKSYSRPAKELIHMPEGDKYTKQQLGVLTFRGDNFRRNAAAGTLSAAPKELKVRWQSEAGSARGTNQTYYGYGWTGQPAIARWSKEVRSLSNIKEEKREKSALKEVIIAGLDGAIRFLDLEDGKSTRNSIKLGYPMRGTPSLHSRGYPFMSVGQFARKMRGKTGKIGLRQYNLFSGKEMKMIDGLDGKYHRPLNNVGSFETSALIDRESDTLIAIGTNGVLYLESLGSTFDYNTGVMQISPSYALMTSKAKGQKNTALLAVESSPAAYDKYVFYADMGGVLRCVDTDTLKPVWAVETGDSVMAAVALDLTGDEESAVRDLNLYTANMLNNRKKGDSSIQIRRYDALSGREIWTTDVGVYKGKKDKDDVGAKASPVIGQNKLEDLVYYTVTGLSSAGLEKLGLGSEDKAALIALDKDTGRIAWSFGLSSRSESSPIALYDGEGNGWIVQCEQNGYVHLLDGRTGSEISRLNLEAEIEASPAAYNNVVVIGTTGKKTSFVYGIEVKLDHSQEGGSDYEEVPGGA